MKTAEQVYEQAMSLHARGDIVGCVQGLQQALLINPKYAEAWNNRASMLLKLGHPFDAIMNYNEAIRVHPGMAELYNNRGAAYIDIGMLDHAMMDYEKALSLKPEFEHALMNQGNVHMKRRDTEKAVDAYRASIKVKSDYVDAHLGLAFALLELGQYEEGFREYEWRWKSEQTVERGLPFPTWDGEKAKDGEALLFYAEQGFGDTLQFIRFVPHLEKVFGGKVYVEVRHPMARLARSLTPNVCVFGEQLPKDIKYTLPMMSAPRVLHMTLSDIPNKVPYLFANQIRRDAWKKDLAQLLPGLKVGICWAGGARPFNPIANAVDGRRSTTLETFAPLAIPGVSFVSLQVGPEAKQCHTPPKGMTILDPSPDIDDFSDTAAIVELLDLVITVDTSVAHLAGALGKPTWLLSRHDNCWRWLRDREDSPWYPTIRQFRQPTAGDWSSMILQVRDELKKLTGEFTNV